MGNEIRTKVDSDSQSNTKVNFREVNDEALVAGVLANDDAAWRELVRRYERNVRGAIFSVFRRYAKVLNSDAREEVLQDFYLSLLENDRYKLRVFDASRSKLVTWLRMIACQKATDHARKVANRPRTVDLDELLDQEDYDSEEDATVEGRSTTAKKRHDVLDAHVWWKAAQAAKKEKP